MYPDERYYNKLKALYYLYEKNYTQVSIAQQLGISRVTLSKLLEEARQEGMIKIQIIDSRNMHAVLESEDQLRSRYQLEDVKIVVGDDGNTDLPYFVSIESAKYLDRFLRSNMKVGIAWGRSIRAMLNYLPGNSSVSNLQIYTLLGGASTDPILQPNLMAQMLANAYHGTIHVINSPYLCHSELLCSEIKKESSVASILANSRSLDIAIVGIGGPPTLSGYFPFNQDIVDELLSLGVVGDICGNFFDAQGKVCSSSISTKTVTIDINDLKKCPKVIAIAYGADKIASIRGALNGHYITALVTDMSTAKRLLE